MTKETVLVIMCGMSPAVITETAWALSRETTPIFPSKVIAITTTEGERCLKKELFDSGMWDSFVKELNPPVGRLEFSPARAFVKVLPTGDGKADAEDILTSVDNNRAADFLIDVVRSHTENPDLNLVFSISGGRKTMGAMGALCMTLLGRKDDRLCHVLVNKPFDDPALAPKFYYPTEKVAEYEYNGKRVPSSSANIILCDIPFAKLRYMFKESWDRLPGGYWDTVRLADRIIQEKQEPVKIVVDPRRVLVMVNEAEVKFSNSEFVAYWLLAWRRKNGLENISGGKSFAEELESFAKEISADKMPSIINHPSQSKSEFGGDSMKLLLTKIRKLLRGKVKPFSHLEQCDPFIARGVYGIKADPKMIDCPDPSQKV